MEDTMNMSRLDITRDRSRHGQDNKADDTTFIRPATPMRVSNVRTAHSQISHISKAKQPTGSLGTQGSQQRAQSGYQPNNSELKPDPQPKVKEEFDYRYAFKSRPKIVNDF